MRLAEFTNVNPHNKHYCPGCRAPVISRCFCPAIKAIANKTPVTFVLHYREFSLSTNTGVLSHKLLKNSKLFLRGEKNYNVSQDLVNEIEYHAPSIPLFLFPSLDSIELGPLLFQKYPDHNFHLIVPDGPWRLAGKIKNRNSYRARDCWIGCRHDFGSQADPTFKAVKRRKSSNPSHRKR